MSRIPPLLVLLAACPSPDDGVVCTEIGCSSSFTVALTHGLAFDDEALHTVVLRTDPIGEVACTVGPGPSGSDSCFGFRFADVAWTETTITVTLAQPFYVSETTPDGEPFDRYEIEVLDGGSSVFRQTFDLGEVTALQPNGPECGPTCYIVERSHDVRP